MFILSFMSTKTFNLTNETPFVSFPFSDFFLNFFTFVEEQKPDQILVQTDPGLRRLCLDKEGSVRE